MKVYARIKIIHDEHAGQMPFNYNIANAVQGFHQCGEEIHFYYCLGEVYNLLEKGDIVLDGIYEVNSYLAKFNIFPQSIDYPEILMPYMGRKVWKDTILIVILNYGDAL